MDRLVLLEGAGPLARNPHDVSKHVRAHVEKRMQSNLSPRKPRIYPNLEVAVKTRCFTAKNFPGDQWLSTEAATELVLRGTERVGDGFRFRHDPRLQLPSCVYTTPDQGDAILKDIQCPTALFLAKQGWPFDEEKQNELMELLKPAICVTLPGSHHFHADPDTADAVAQKVVDFFDFT